MKKTIFSIITCILLIVNTIAQDTLFVKSSEASTAWAGRTTYTNLQEAIDAAQAGDVIWVAEGTYYPTRTFGNNSDTRCKSFIMRDSITLYGGFLGTESSIDVRPMDHYATNYPSVLSGDFANTPDVATDNSYHVVYCNGITDVTLDGFSISGGYANRNAYEAEMKGGGAYLGARCHLQNCTIENNTAMRSGGGVWVSSTATLSNCYLTGNSVTAANSSGGGAFFENRGYDISVAATNCVFEENSCAATLTSTTSTQYGGGAVASGQNTIFEGCYFIVNSCTTNGGAITCSNGNTFNYCEFHLNQAASGAAIYGGTSSNLLTSNCLFTNNEATSNGGAIFVSGNSCRAINCTFASNTATNGGAVYGTSGFTLFNSIVWNNGSDTDNQVAGSSSVTCMYTAIQGVAATGEGNLNVTTEEIDFISPCSVLGVPTDENDLNEVLTANYNISAISVCKDTGNLGTLYLSGYHFPDIDLNGEERVVGSAIDLGCYENSCENIAPEFTWTIVDTTYNDDVPGTGTVTIEFTITNYNEDYTLILDNTPITLDNNTFSIPFSFPGTGTFTLSYIDGECYGESSTVISLDSLFAPVGIVENDLHTLTIYPIPTHNSLTLESDSPIHKITVFDLTGRTMMMTGNDGKAVGTECTASSIQPHQSTLNVSSLPAGIYLIQAVTANGVKTARFVKH